MRVAATASKLGRESGMNRFGDMPGLDLVVLGGEEKNYGKQQSCEREKRENG